MDAAELFETIAHALHVEEDTKGECWITCPECGREDEKCSFSEKGWHCFVCGGGGGLKNLAELLNVQKFEPYHPPRRKKEAKPPRSFLWQERANHVLGEFVSYPDRLSLWQTYRPFTERTIQRWSLGVGILPSCRCKHQRLIYPAYDGEKIVAFRGRRIACECDEKKYKWLQAAGSTVALWGFELLFEHQTVIVCESPVDAMLAMQEHSGVVAVASTGGAGTWRDEWTGWLFRSHPYHVVVWYDNDLAGAPTPETFRQLAAEWRQKHPEAKKLPRANGPWVTNKLLKAGLPAALYHWPTGTPPKTDLSSVYMENRR